MIVFEVLLNGELLVRAGRNDLSVLNLSVSALGLLGSESLGTKALKDDLKLNLHVGGATNEDFAEWIPKKCISVDDEIILRISESSNADPNITLNYTEEQIEQIKKHNETAEQLRYEKAKKTYLELREKYEQPSNG